jgi:hypothetical protein
VGAGLSSAPSRLDGHNEPYSFIASHRLLVNTGGIIGFNGH